MCKMNEFNLKEARVPTFSNPRQRVTPEFSPGVPVADFVPIAPTLKSLKIGEIAIFPYEQRSSVLATVYRLRKEFKRQGWDVELMDEKEDGEDCIFRIKRVG